MEEAKFTIVRYHDGMAAVWDQFLQESVNGTFLQSRNFLSYHPQGRFDDWSLLIYDKKNNLAGVCPGTKCTRGGTMFRIASWNNFWRPDCTKEVLSGGQAD